VGQLAAAASKQRFENHDCFLHYKAPRNLAIITFLIIYYFFKTILYLVILTERSFIHRKIHTQVVNTCFKHFNNLYIGKSTVYHKHKIYSKYILNSSKFNTLIKIIELKQI